MANLKDVDALTRAPYHALRDRLAECVYRSGCLLQRKRSLREELKRLFRFDLFFIDEAGCIRFGRPSANLFFQVVKPTGDQGSTMISSDRAFSGSG